MAVIVTGMDMPKEKCDGCSFRLGGGSDYCTKMDDKTWVIQELKICPLKSVEGLIEKVEKLKPNNPNFEHYTGETRAINSVIEVIKEYCEVKESQ